MLNNKRLSRWLTFFTLAATFALALPARANTAATATGKPRGGSECRSCCRRQWRFSGSDCEKYNVGFLALLQANPGVDPYVPRPGSVLTIPLQTLLPDAPREGIVINLAELRLYYYQPGQIR